jgi:hypothetical protein
VDVAALPPLIPLATGSCNAALPAASMYAVSMGDLFRLRKQHHGTSRIETRHNIRATHGLEQDATLLLTGNAEDAVLEWMWANPAAVRETIKKNHFAYAIAPNFSVYGDRCPLEWAYNLRRSNLLLDDLRDVTDNAIPVLSLPNRFFEDRVLDWVRHYPAVNVVSFNAQMMRDDREFAAGLAAIVRLESRAGRPLHFVITGPTSDSRIAAVRQQLASATVVSSYHLQDWLHRN